MKYCFKITYLLIYKQVYYSYGKFHPMTIHKTLIDHHHRAETQYHASHPTQTEKTPPQKYYPAPHN